MSLISFRHPVGNLGLALAFLIGASTSQVKAQVPTIKLQDVPEEVLIGETFTFRLLVSPHPTDIGYGPFLEIYLPYQGADCTTGSERCDGVSFVSAETVFEVTHLPLSPCPAGPMPYVPGTTCGGPNPNQCPGTTNEPPAPTSCFFGLTPPVCTLSPPGFPAGYQKVVLELKPIGSFAPNQAPILVEIKAQVDSFADAGVPLFFYVRSGFRFGTNAQGGTAIADPACPMIGGKITPTVATIKKSYDGPENETATGPNFPHNYGIKVNIANGQTIEPLKVIECLPDNVLTYGQSLPDICSGFTFPTPACPNDGFELQCSSVKGTDSAVDLEIKDLRFFVNDLDFAGEPVLGSCTAPAKSINDVKLMGDWFPLDPRDTPPVPISSDVTPADHTLADRCIAIQKKHKLLSDPGSDGPTPGDTVRYILKFQVSDFLTLGDIVVDDYLSDGQSYVPGSATIEVHDKFGVVAANTPLTEVQTSQFNGTYSCSDGHPLANPQLLTFAVSQQLASLHPTVPRHAAGILTGGHAGLPTAGGTTGKIKFDAKIDDEYQRQDLPPERRFVDKDDELLNCVEIQAEVLTNNDSPVTPSSTGDIASDHSLQLLSIAHGTVTNTVYAVNGDTDVTQPVKVNPGDFVTFHVGYTIPSGDAEDFFFEDYLPLPVLRTDQLKYGACLTPPPTKEEAVTVTGPLCGVPTLTPGNAPNSFKLSFQNFNNPDNEEVDVDVYFTTQVRAEPYADGLLLSNHVLQHEKNTSGDTFSQTEVAPIILGEPALRIRKGVVSSDKRDKQDNDLAVYTPRKPVPSGVIFARPGDPGTAFTGQPQPLTSSNIGTALNSDVSHVDACDLLKFAIVVENFGSSSKGAFDVTIRDTLPLRLKYPKSFSNLQIVNGKGDPFSCNGGKVCSSLIDSFFNEGIMLDDIIDEDGNERGALAAYSLEGGDNLAVITFDAKIPCDIPITGCRKNVAEILHYAGVADNGPNHTSAAFSMPFPDTQNAFADNANLCVQPRLGKTILRTSEPHTKKVDRAEPLAIGEIVTYRLELVVPEGSPVNMTITDTLPSGLQWVKDRKDSCSVHKSQLISTKEPPEINLEGATLTINLGRVTNNATSQNTPDQEIIFVECEALALDDSVKEIKNNSFLVQLNPGEPTEVSFRSGAVPAQIVVPVLVMNKEEVLHDSPDGATYLLRFTNIGTATAFDVALTDDLPSPLEVSGTVDPPPGCSVAYTYNQVKVTCAEVHVQESREVRFNVTKIPLCEAVENRAQLTYSTLPGLKENERTVSTSASATTTRCPDLTLTKSHIGDFPLGQSGIYNVTVKNNGNVPSVPPYAVEDSLPDGLTFLSGGGNGWTCASDNGHNVTCTSGAVIQPGESSSFTFRVKVPIDQETVENCATVSTQEELNSTNNSFCDLTRFRRVAACEFIDIAAGGEHSLALKSDGTVLMWGDDGADDPFGTNVNPAPIPGPVAGLVNILDIAAGGNHSLALRDDGTVWAWGSNRLGQLGNRAATSFGPPVQVNGLAGVIAIAAGGYHSLALKSNGTLYAWGGVGIILLNRIETVTDVVAIAAGLDFSLVVRRDGTVWASGRNESGQLGNGSMSVSSSGPTQVQGLGGIVEVAAGENHSLALDGNGRVWAWGSNKLGKLGNGTTVSSNVPVQVKGLTDVVAIAAGRYHSMALRKDGTVWAWGGNSFGQLGNGSSPASSKVPLLVRDAFAPDVRAIAIAAGGVHSLLLEIGGTRINAWGNNASGQLGDGTTASAETPVAVTGLCTCVPPPGVIVNPAATLLLPFFEVELGGPSGRNTVFSINNAGTSPVLAHVTIWTDLAVPVFAFDVYLTSHGGQFVDLYKIFVKGELPGMAPVPIPSCSHLPLNLEQIQAWLQGNPFPSVTGDCAGSHKGDNILRGYITVDTVNACNSFFPSDWAPYAPFITSQNVLWGDYSYIHNNGHGCFTANLVHIEACPTCFKPGDHTFYGRYNGASAADARKALPTTMETSFKFGDIFDDLPSLVVWRETGASASAYSCSSQGPSWYPLESKEIVLFDNNGQCFSQAVNKSPEKAASNIDILPPAGVKSGKIYLNLQHSELAPPYSDTAAQAWVTLVTFVQSGQCGTGSAVPLDCANAPTSCAISTTTCTCK